jgi:hypothetical protein
MTTKEEQKMERRNTDLAGFDRNRSRSLVLIEELNGTWRGSQSHSFVPRDTA